MKKKEKLNRRNLLKLSLIPGALLLKACGTPATRSQTRQSTRVQGRTEHRQDRRRDW